MSDLSPAPASPPDGLPTMADLDALTAELDQVDATLVRLDQPGALPQQGDQAEVT